MSNTNSRDSINIKKFEEIIQKNINELCAIDDRYLNEAGHAAKRAYRDAIEYISFYDTLEEYVKEGHVKSLLLAAPGKHQEYYRVLRMINRFLEIALATKR